MLFNFRFFDFAEITSELRQREQATEIHALPSWYHLTDGWYWIEVGETQLFRYTQSFSQSLEQIDSRPSHERYVDYFVVDLWENLLEILPAILEPVPQVLAQRLNKVDQWTAWMNTWYVWNMTKSRSDERGDEDEGAVAWWLERKLDTGYLVEGPEICVWNDGENMHIAWDNRRRVHAGTPVWEAQVGQFVLPVQVFLTELTIFLRSFLTAMATRIDKAQEYWLPEEYAQEFVWLREEQEKRISFLESNLCQIEAKDYNMNWKSFGFYRVC